MADPAVLVVQHERDAPGGWLAEGLLAAGCHLDVSRPYDGEPLPEPSRTDAYDGIVVLGGAMAAWDDLAAPWLPATRALVREAEAAGVPVLGVCLGHQLAAAALGGRAEPNPAGTTLAVLPVCWAADAGEDPLFTDVQDLALGVHWNNDVVTVLPPGASVLATSPDGAVQAARLGRSVWGVQFHPEAGPEIVGRWVEQEGAAYAAAGHDLERYLTDLRDHEATLADGCRRLAGSFARLTGAT